MGASLRLHGRLLHASHSEAATGRRSPKVIEGKRASRKIVRADKLASDKKTNFSDFSLRNVIRHGRTEEGNCSYRTPPDA
jgi:hypothetical protein